MLIVRNNIIPLKSYKAMSAWPFIFVREEAEVDAVTLLHEEIHGRQQKELLIVFFFLWYGMEWLIRLAAYRNAHKAYRMVSFEQEAYIHEDNADYLSIRKHYAWIRYIFFK